MPEPEELLIQKIKREIAQKHKLNEIKSFRLEQFLKEYRQNPNCLYFRKASQQNDDKEQPTSKPAHSP